MKIGFIGLGKMGGNMIKRLVSAGHEVVAHDINQAASEEAKASGAALALDRQNLVDQLETAVVWLMIPSQFVDVEIDELLKIMPAGSVIIDGGNSDFRLSRQRYERCKTKDISFVDVGTSGGILGLENGYSIMVGGEKSVVDGLATIFAALAPPNGWDYFGESGSGHYVKMVHNAIEYGLMESYAEGYRMLRDGPFEHIDLAAAGKVWSKGSIISSLLNELITEALEENPTLSGIDGTVAESGETRWTLEVAEDLDIKLPVIKQAMQVRLDTQKGEINFSTKLLSAMRNKFGGHSLNQGKK